MEETYMWNKMKKFVNDVKEEVILEEDGSVVETVIIVAVLALITIAAATVIGNAVKSKANDAANTITGVDWK